MQSRRTSIDLQVESVDLRPLVAARFSASVCILGHCVTPLKNCSGSVGGLLTDTV